jgi:hypothetical protein
LDIIDREGLRDWLTNTVLTNTLGGGDQLGQLVETTVNLGVDTEGRLFNRCDKG